MKTLPTAIPEHGLVAARTEGIVPTLQAVGGRPSAQHVAAMEWGVRGVRRRPVVPTPGPGRAGQAAGPGCPSGLAEAIAALESSASS
ncbi:hypothetical protein [Streptomyces sp. ML-6]|uniref:hypothetical protein n=1 Tax=Streptomyces sp. ML-6 TaxID=2982693 RepID=UPI0024BF26EC|nr:hypothetical protein [Streptomyces sp. ML-6]MDK0524113.1 hypothetical protein [Streptomyces sp. ML-6]